MTLCKRLAGAVCLLCLTVQTASCFTLVNEDKAAYSYAVYWEDLSGVDKGSVEPGASVELPDKAGLVELIGKRDNIYVRPGDIVRIHRGVMRIPEKKE